MAIQLLSIDSWRSFIVLVIPVCNPVPILIDQATVFLTGPNGGMNLASFLEDFNALACTTGDIVLPVLVDRTPD